MSLTGPPFSFAAAAAQTFPLDLAGGLPPMLNESSLEYYNTQSTSLDLDTYPLSLDMDVNDTYDEGKHSNLNFRDTSYTSQGK